MSVCLMLEADMFDSSPDFCLKQTFIWDKHLSNIDIYPFVIWSKQKRLSDTGVCLKKNFIYTMSETEIFHYPLSEAHTDICLS